MEVPIDNNEVLDVLTHRQEKSEFIDGIIDYIQQVKTPNDFPISILRKCKGLESSLFDLTVLSNTNDISTINSYSDVKKIKQAVQLK